MEKYRVEKVIETNEADKTHVIYYDVFDDKDRLLATCAKSADARHIVDLLNNEEIKKEEKVA